MIPITRFNRYFFRGLIAALALSFGIVINVLAQGEKTAKGESSYAYKKAYVVAEAIDMLIRSARAKYTQIVTGKLKKDGTGSSVDHLEKKGFTPLPSQYVRAIAFDVTLKSRNKKNSFSFYLRSLWNLNPEQGLNNDFEREGWKFIARQQQEHLNAGKSLKTMRWEPYVDVDMVNGKKTLRYLSADSGSKISCVTCHNSWEQKNSIKAIRKEQGVESGKVFSLHELMGVLVIYVPLGEE